MIFANIRFALRHLIKNKVFLVINILGLSLALLASVNILKYAAYEYSFDSFHESSNEIYRLTISYTDTNDEYVRHAGVSNDLARLIRENIPEVSEVGNLYPLVRNFRQLVVSNNNTELPLQYNVENAWSSDFGIFDIFTFKVIYGDFKNLEKVKSAVAINRSTAEQFFGKDNPVGKSLTLNNEYQFTIGLVFEDWPDNTHLNPELIFQDRYYYAYKQAFMAPNLHFLGSGSYVYLKIATGQDTPSVLSKLNELSRTHRQSQDLPGTKLHLTPLSDIHLDSDDLLNDMAKVADGKTLILMLILAALIWLMAWMNYTNLLTSVTLQRAKNVAIRRIHGETNYSLIYQLFLNSLIILVFAFLIFATFNQIFSAELDQLIGYGSWKALIEHNWLLPLSIFLLLLGVLISALYPTFLLSSYSHMDVLKERLKHSYSGVSFKKVLVVSQYAITIGLLFGTLVVVNQIRHLKEFDTHVDLSKVLVVKGPVIEGGRFYESELEIFKNKLLKASGVELVSTSSYVPGYAVNYKASLTSSLIDNKTNYISRIFVDDDFIETYDINVLAGRSFLEDSKVEIKRRPIILNESAASKLGFDLPEDAINKQVLQWGEPVKIVGVIEDFSMESPDKPIEPLFLFPAIESKYFSVKYSKQEAEGIIQMVKDSWSETYPGKPFEYFHAEINFARQYASFEQTEKQLIMLVSLCIIIASMGLFALNLEASRARKREVAIRKVLGASVLSVITLFVKEYLRFISIAAILIVPLTYYLLNSWLDNYANRIVIDLGLVTLPVITILLLAMIIIVSQVVKVSNSAPSASLRQD